MVFGFAGDLVGAETEGIGLDGVFIFGGADGFADIGVIEKAETPVVVACTGLVYYAGIEQADKAQFDEFVLLEEFGEAVAREEFDGGEYAAGRGEDIKGFADHRYIS